MRLKGPTCAIIDQVRITREGNDAIIDYADAGIAGTHVTIGPDIATSTTVKSSACSTASSQLKNDSGRLGQDGHRRTAGDNRIDNHE